MVAGETRGCEPDDNCENPGALPPFPAWEGVLATEIGEPSRTDGCDFWSEATDWEIKSITSESAVALPAFEIFSYATGLLSSLACANTLARACAICCFISLRTSVLIRAASEGEMVVPLYYDVFSYFPNDFSNSSRCFFNTNLVY